MRLLLIGGGGREHALAWKLAQSPLVEMIYVAPGNPGIALLDKCECVDLPLQEMEKVADYAEANSIDLTVVGPEASLVDGIADVFIARGLALFGPSKAAAELEGSKAFSKQLMEKYNIPTAFFKVCEDIVTAKAYVKEKGAPIVVKADGLAAGKGVVVAMTEQEALDAIDDMMGDLKFGGAGARVVLEEFMEGEEASLLAFTDGETIVSMIAAQDHKRANDNDEGPNTGGMGTYAPAPVMTDILRLKAVEKVLKPTIAAMKAEGRPYQGCLYAGLMINGDSIKVVEFNCRFGDPETQVIMPLLDGDLAEIMLACATGTLAKADIGWHDQAAVCVVMASGGYPGSYQQGLPISGLAEADALEGVAVFHAGTKVVDGQIVTAGGRVLGVTAVGKNISEAKDKAYEAIAKISFEGAHYRQDIAWRALKK
ncbi:phosphoribosylamine--glycine ligase [uncultured Phascolarctobacterium sp.]|uniref:phosphoribosylamine--glycine ligase n=1 Tax=uncultured Phascolarctobacterium sp. TaxID=512296 RepID=UPI0015AF0A68|nr:phosphoribosylamine--glycine ligase [uncultured Phascolarctobacterium sp.]